MVEKLREETVSSERPWEGRLIQVRVDRVRLPQGHETRRELVEHAPAVAVVPLAAEGQVTLVRQWRHPAGQALLEIPAGVMERGEDPRECAERELQEEIGMWPGSLEYLMTVYLAPGYSEEEIHLYVAEKLEPRSLEADDDENLEVVKMPLEEAIAKAASGEMQDAKTVVALLAVAQRRVERRL
jgi:ADP-ribose pyrophosphatase